VPFCSAFRSLLLVGLAVTVPRAADAAPQWGTGIVAGVAGTGDDFRWSRTKFYGALRGEALFGGPGGVRVGPAIELGTAGFSDGRFGGGATVLLPLGEILALGVTPVAYARLGNGEATAGVSGRVFWGVHPANRVGDYALAGGLLVGVDRDVGASRSSALIVGAQVDGLVLALPAILLFEWLRGPRD
jgi:hypothetical protein